MEEPLHTFWPPRRCKGTIIICSIHRTICEVIDCLWKSIVCALLGSFGSAISWCKDEICMDSYIEPQPINQRYSDVVLLSNDCSNFNLSGVQLPDSHS